MSNWYLQNGKESDVVVNTKVRLVRNIKGFNFTNKLSSKERTQILNLIKNIIPNLGYDLKLLELKDMNQITKNSLVEKTIINQEFANKNEEEYAILINDDENICITINDEDHIGIQLFSEGLSTENLMNLAIEIDKKIEKEISYSYSEKYGYLTACPTNLGTGLEVFTIVHLPALAKTGNMMKIFKIIENFGMNIKGLYGEAIESRGNLYQISNAQTLGVSEEEISKSVKAITEKIIEQERVARNYLGKTGIELENKLYRAFGILNFSKKISMDECIELLSDVKLGTDMGIIKELDDSKVKKLCLYTKPANLQKYCGQTLGEKEMLAKRAELIHQIINE